MTKGEGNCRIKAWIDVEHMVIQKAAKKQGHNGCTQKYAVKIALFENDLNGLYPVQAVAEYTENAAG